jgi:phosphoserine phosphatase
MASKESKTQWTGPQGDKATEARLAGLATAGVRITALTRVIEGNQQQITVVLDESHDCPRLTEAPHLTVLDVDSTLIDQEVIDLLAEYTGVGEEVARITERAMQGEIDFEQALRKRVGLLTGTPASAIESISSAVTLRHGAEELVKVLQAHGCQVGLVSGGFVQVIAPVANALGIDLVAANQLEVANDEITGRLDGPIVDRQGKAQALERFAQDANVSAANTVAIGDGANDIEMLKVANYGIAFNAKPALQEVADVVVTSPYLSDCLYVLGLTPRAT